MSELDRQSAYVTDDAATIEAFDTWMTEMEAFYEYLTGLKARFGNRDVYTTESAMGRHKRIVGFQAQSDDYYRSSDLPEGLRLDKRRGMLVPRLGSKIGKALALELDSHSIMRPTFSGMPPFLLTGDGDVVGIRAVSPAAQVIGGHLYSFWPCRRELVTTDPAFDQAIWTPIPLSGYYAALESVKEPA